MKPVIIVISLALSLCSCSILNPNYYDCSIDISSDNKSLLSDGYISPGIDKSVSIKADSPFATIDKIQIRKGSLVLLNTNISSKSYTHILEIDAPRINGTDNYTVLATVAGKEISQSFSIISRPLFPLPSVLDIGYSEQVIPEIFSTTGGLQLSPQPTGSVYYFNQAHTKSESDVQLDYPIYYQMTVKRYLKVSGTAIPDDSGFIDRVYHFCNFQVVLLDNANNTVDTYSYTFLVDGNNKFNGYLYFPISGKYKVYAYREYNDNLYPRTKGIGNSVAEGWSTLLFTVTNAESISPDVIPFLPTRSTDSANPIISTYSRYLTKYCTTDLEKAKVLYHFIVFGDENGDFKYTYDNDQWPSIATANSSFHIASNFIIDRVGVCNDFSELYAAMLRSLKIEVKKQSGEKDTINPGHMWNIVFINGKTYHVDSTWGNGDKSNYKTYAEFYNTFVLSDFLNTHDESYSMNSLLEF